ncbi:MULTISPECIES: paeninodin family lasso peptide [Cytobacillus]|uniref:Paeninodin family lasso peptide n=1 Tax=Cytobacillus stercorigallinarum TaxID=2762240 RepID=A0ABR8QU65_9BACI|nr:paeninodin family lasso peptide [Cytobacillus stercorigallinarum]MBD7939078.1 paeninodin family lasso peptide [Cytobacillus stercorigallinarum]
MKKPWGEVKLEVLDVKMTMKGGGHGGGKHPHDPADPEPETDIYS